MRKAPADHSVDVSFNDLTYDQRFNGEGLLGDVSSLRSKGTGMTRVALVVGATGIIGGALTQELVREGWPVLGLARRPSSENPGVFPISAVVSPVVV